MAQLVTFSLSLGRNGHHGTVLRTAHPAQHSAWAPC